MADPPPEEVQHNMAFSNEADFEGGQWVNGEFYYEKKRNRHRQQTKADAIYGVFNGENSSDEDSGRRSKRGRGGLVEAFRPVTFTPAGAAAPAAGASQARTNDEFAKLVKQGVRKPKPPPKQEETSKRVDPRAGIKKPAVKLGSDFASWSKSGKGFGMKMLKMMGFKGRLGKHEQGTSVPIAVKVRKRNAGLAADGHEAVHLKENREFEKDFYGESKDHASIPEGNEIASGAMANANQEMARAWRRKEQKSRKTVYKTAAQLLAEQQQNKAAAAPAAQVVLDYRGPQVRKISNLNEISRHDHAIAAAAVASIGKELLWNTDKLVLMAEERIMGLSRRLITEKDAVVALEYELRNLEATAPKIGGVGVEDAMRMVARATAEAHLLQPSQLLAVLTDLRTCHRIEWEQFELNMLVLALVPACLSKALKSWRPLEDGPAPLAELLRPWQLLLGAVGVDVDAVEEEEKSRQIYANVAKKVVLGPLRGAIVNAWKVREPGPCIELLEGLLPVLPHGLLQHSVLEQLVLPKLSRAVEQWDPREETVRIDVWVQPWLHPALLGPARLAPLWPTIRRRLSSALRQWQPSDASAHTVLAPWAKVFTKQHMTELLNTQITPKLAASLRSLKIDPRAENPKPVQWTLAWADLLPPSQLHALLAGEFFPKWLHVLGKWLLPAPGAARPDFGQIEQWYRGWKSVFGSLLESRPRLKAPFQQAMRLLGAVASGKMAEAKRMVQALPAPGSRSYKLVMEQHRLRFRVAADSVLRQKAEEKAIARAQAAAARQHKLTFREVVELFSSKHGVSFTPQVKRARVDGKQVYSFGKLNVYIDHDVVFVQNAKKRYEWDPIDLEELLKQARAKGLF